MPRALPKKPKVSKSAATRARILDAALALFRKRGFERTTMHDIAATADVAQGAAYYYFRSKEAILLAYYTRHQEEHEARVDQALAAVTGLRARLGAVMHTKLAAMARDRKLLGAMVQRLADPSDPISAFAAETAEVRRRAMAIFARALDGEALSEELQRLAAVALWMLHMGFMLYFVRDGSVRQTKTRALIDDTLDLVVPIIYLGAQPFTQPLVAQLLRALSRADLLPEP